MAFDTEARPGPRQRLEMIEAVIAEWIPPDSAVTDREALARIIEVLEIGQDGGTSAAPDGRDV